MKNMGQTTKYTKPNKMFAQIKTEMEDKAKKRSKSTLAVQEVEYIDKQRNIAIRSDVSIDNIPSRHFKICLKFIAALN